MSREHLLQVINGIAAPGWIAQPGEGTLIFSSVEHRNPRFTPNIVVLDVGVDEPVISTPSSSLKLSCHSFEDTPIRFRQLLVDYSMVVAVTSEVVIVESTDGFLQIIASAAHGDVGLISDFLPSVLSTICGDV